MKKILALLIVFALLLGGIPVFAANITAATSLLRELSIMQGDPDGNLRLDDYVSRAEFTKIAVAASTYKNSVASGLTVSPFMDVPAGHWASPYIIVGANSGLIKGYTDATFRPDNDVLFEEAVTIMLKVLGYADEDFGVSWPYGQIGLANNLEITKGVTASAGVSMTRGEVAQLIYNTLNTKMKNSQQKLISVFDCKLIENVVLIATANEDSSVGSDRVVTTGGTYKLGNYDVGGLIGRRGDLIVKNDEHFVSFNPNDQLVTSYDVTGVIGSDLLLDGKSLNINENLPVYRKSQTTTYKNVIADAQKGDTFLLFSGANGVADYGMLITAPLDINVNTLDKYVIYSKLANAVVGYNDGAFTQIDINDGTACYKDKVRSTYGAVKAELSMGDVLYVKKNENGTIDYVSYEKGNVEGPITVASVGDLSAWTAKSPKIMRNGNEVSLSEVKTNDVVYYISDLNLILAYSDKITGVYENALPNRDAPSSVVISGITYELEGVAAFNKLCSAGQFNYGDAVTVMLGKTGKIADVMVNNLRETVYGYIFETGIKSYTKSNNDKYTAPYIKIAMVGGGEYEYIADKDYKSYINSVVKVSFTDSIARVTPANSVKPGLSGKFEWNNKRLGSAYLAYDLKILDVATTDKSKKGNFVTVFPGRVDGIVLDSYRILYTEENDNGEISAIILNDVTGDAYTYGIITRAGGADGRVSGSFTYDVAGVPRNGSTGGATFNVYESNPVKIGYGVNGEISTITALNKANEVITDLTAVQLRAGGRVYSISDKAVVYKVDSNYNYIVVPLSEIVDAKNYNITAYYDKPSSDGGRVRIIVLR